MHSFMLILGLERFRFNKHHLLLQIARDWVFLDLGYTHSSSFLNIFGITHWVNFVGGSGFSHWVHFFWVGKKFLVNTKKVNAHFHVDFGFGEA